MKKKEPQYINLSTPPDVILATMEQERASVEYFARKPYGGKRKYAQMEDQLLDKALAEKQNQMSELQYYISHAGNRWMMYTQVDYYPKALHAHATHIACIYYETYGSCGAFFPLYVPNSHKPIGVVIYTSHFFLRMSERTGKEYRSKELIREFLMTRLTTASQADEDGEVIVKFKGGFGFGKLRGNDPMTLEVRTFLTDGELTNKQRRKVDKLNAFYELVGEGKHLKEVVLGNLVNNDASPEEMAQQINHNVKLIEKLGMGDFATLSWGVVTAFMGLTNRINGLPDADPKLVAAAIVPAVQEETMELCMKWQHHDWEHSTEEQNAAFEEEMIACFARAAKRLHFGWTKETIREELRKVKEEGDEVKSEK